MQSKAQPSQLAGNPLHNSDVADFIENFDFVRSESMEVKNDPRFFQDNVLNKRVKAFAAVAVVATLLVRSSMKEMFGMNKNMQIVTSRGERWHFNGVVQLLSFIMLIAVFIINMVAAYVGVAQPYHTIRLMTAGPTGFEAAAWYYLNKNMIAWRHMSIKYMLLSIPLYISQMGFRLIVKFDRETEAAADLPGNVPWNSRVEGATFSVILACSALMLYSVHAKHFGVFRECYDSMAKEVTGGVGQYLRTLNRAGGAHLDV